MYNTQNTYNTQHKVIWRRRVGLLTCIICIPRIRHITHRKMIERKGLYLISRLIHLKPSVCKTQFRGVKRGAYNKYIMHNTHKTHNTQNNYDMRKGSEAQNVYNMHNSQNTYNTQHKVNLRRRVCLVTGITCITRISCITLRTMIEG